MVLVRRSALIFLLFTIVTGQAFSSGMSLHYAMSKQAADKAEGSLGFFLKKHMQIILSGTVFPDTGYIGKKRYGHFLHSTTFFNAYAEYLDRHCKFPLNKKCLKLTAHLFGSVAHEAQDHNFDKYFLREVARLEFNGDRQKAQKYTDMTMDFIAIYKDKLWMTIPLGFWIPQYDLEKILKGLGKKYSAHLLYQNALTHYMATLGMRVASPFVYLYKKNLSPWAVENYRTARGGINDTSYVVLRLWEKMWNRLQTQKSFKGLSHFYRRGGQGSEFGFE